MCEPATLIAVTTTALSTALTAVSQVSSAQTQAAQARYNAQAMQQNALLARRQASFDATRQREQARRLLGQQRARGAATGIDLSGSFADVTGRTAEDQELDALATLYGGEVEARGFENRARMHQWEAANTEASLAPSLTGTLLGGGLSMAGSLGGISLGGKSKV